MNRLAYKGFVYEAVNEKELEFIYDKMAEALGNLNDVLNTVHDGNQKKALSSLMKKTRETFNEKIKGVDYHPADIDSMQKTADDVDQQMQVDQMANEQSAPSPKEVVSEKYA